MSDVFEEVEESLRQDKATQLWRRFAPLVWAAVALAVGAVAAREYFAAEAEKSAEVRAERLDKGLQALADGNYSDARETLEAVVSDAGPLKPLAANYLAQIQIEGGGDVAAAVETLKSTGSSSDAPLATLATLKAAYLGADTATRADLEAQLGGLVDAETAFGALAQELVAAKAVVEGDADFARQTYNYLRFAAYAPAGVIQRADIALAALPPEKAAVTTTPAEPGTPETPAETAAPTEEASE
ncbi:MAG: hypothetical protein AAFQ21_02085 [Pseudomonadota bacterium]